MHTLLSVCIYLPTVCDNITLSFVFVPVSFIRKGQIVCTGGPFVSLVKPSGRMEEKRLCINQMIVWCTYAIRCAV